jgi:NADH-quinone oxidoreductase subunit I
MTEHRHNEPRQPGLLDAAKALGKGMATTAKVLARKPHTAQYPHVEPDLPDRSRGVIALLESNCTSCMLCARECPDWCIYIDSHKEQLEPAGEQRGGRARVVNKLDRFDIDYSLCMYCGICIEVCPFDALFWAPDFAYAEGDIRNLLHGKDRLETWMETVPEDVLPEGGRGGRAAAEAAKAAAVAQPAVEEEVAVEAVAAREVEDAEEAQEVAGPGAPGSEGTSGGIKEPSKDEPSKDEPSKDQPSKDQPSKDEGAE